MSVLGLMAAKEQDAGPGGIEAPSTTLWDVASASADAAVRNYNLFSKDLFTGLETDNNAQTYKQLTGRNIQQDAYDAAPNRDELYKSIGTDSEGSSEKRKAAIDAHVLALRTQDPEKYASLKTSQEIDETVKAKALAAQATQAKTTAGATGISSFIGQLGGGLAAGLVDPVNLATIPLGAGLAGGIVKTALVDAGVNVAAEAVNYPFVQKWQKELGQEYGPSTFVENAGIAALFGLVIGGGGKALAHGIEKLNPPNSVKIAEIRERLGDNFEGQQAARHEERRLHIDESDPSKYTSEVSPEVQPRALEEVDAAINEERPVDAGKIEVSDEQIRAMDESKMDDSLAAAHENIVAESPEPREPREGTNEIFENQTRDEAPVENHQELVDMHDKPEVVTQEKADFEEATKDLPPDHQLFVGENGETMTLQELKDSFKDDAEYLSAISSCGIGGE